MKSVMVHQFDRIPRPQVGRSLMDLSRRRTMMVNADYLYPCFVEEAIAGDTWRMAIKIFARLVTPLVAFFDNVFVETFFFYSPMRIHWDKFREFWGEAATYGKPVTTHVIPKLLAPSGAAPNDGWQKESLADHFFLPVYKKGIEANVIPFRMYNDIWTRYFRDQDLQDVAPHHVGSTTYPGETINDYPLRKRCRIRDYFSSCRPWAQKHDDVPLPIGGTAPIRGTGKAIGIMGIDGATVQTAGLIHNTGGMVTVDDDSYDADMGDISSQATNIDGTSAISITSDYTKSGMEAVLSEATETSVNSFRRAIALQHMYEADVRGGSRYAELLEFHFGVNVPMAIEEPIYIGGSSSPLYQSLVPQTSESGTTPQGNLSAYVQCLGNGFFTYTVTEPGYIMGLVNIRGDIRYQHCLKRMWTRETREEFFWPELQGIGDQPVLYQELYCQDADLIDEGDTIPKNLMTFGFQEKDADYMYGLSEVTGVLRTITGEGMDIYHLADRYNACPELNDTWIQANTPLNDILAVGEDGKHAFVDIYFDCKVARPMKMYSVPGVGRL